MTISRREFAAGGAALAASLVLVPGALALPPTPADVAVKDVYTFFVAGLDTRNPDEPENTDVMMLTRVTVSTGTIRTVSIPRDLYVAIPGYGYDKINRAYDYGSKASDHDWNAGVAVSDQTIAANFGIDPDAVITTSFDGWPKIVDAVGGVTVNNPYDVSDTQYPTADYGVKEIFYPAGELNLSGEQALEFCRTRHQDGDDGRVMRQQLVLTALLQKAQSPDILPKLPKIIDATRDAVITNVPAAVQTQLMTSIGNFSPDTLVWGTFTDQLYGGTIDNGMWVYQADWSTLPGWVQAFLDGQI